MYILPVTHKAISKSPISIAPRALRDKKNSLRLPWHLSYQNIFGAFRSLSLFPKIQLWALRFLWDLQNIPTGWSKKCHDFDRMPFPQLLMEPIVLRTRCSQHLSILIDKNSSQTLQWYSHQRRKSKCHILVQEQTVAKMSSALWRVLHRISGSFPVSSLFRGLWALSRQRAQFPAPIRSATIDQHQLQIPEDYRWRTGISYFRHG